MRLIYGMERAEPQQFAVQGRYKNEKKIRLLDRKAFRLPGRHWPTATESAVLREWKYGPAHGIKQKFRRNGYGREP